MRLYNGVKELLWTRDDSSGLVEIYSGGRKVNIYSMDRGRDLVFSDAPDALLEVLDKDNGKFQPADFLRILEEKGYEANRVTFPYIPEHRVQIDTYSGKIRAHFPGKLPRDYRRKIELLSERHSLNISRIRKI